MDVARCLVARARPTVPEAQLGQSGTFTRGGPGCSQARPSSRPARGSGGSVVRVSGPGRETGPGRPRRPARSSGGGVVRVAGGPGPAHAPETCGWCWPRARQYPTCGPTDTARGPGSRIG
jgi:hypothetical protein